MMFSAVENTNAASAMFAEASFNCAHRSSFMSIIISLGAIFVASIFVAIIIITVPVLALLAIISIILISILLLPQAQRFRKRTPV